MSENINIICFKHCRSSSVFCKQIPKACPICQDLLNTFLLEPFAIPYPLVNAKDYPCCIVVRPSNGNFLDNYNVNDDLHIGITNSNGVIIEFDKCGIVVNDNANWKYCAAISLIPVSWQTFWDEILKEMCSDSLWTVTNYDEVNFNCFSFVIAFLKNLQFSDIQFMDKEDMCKVFILPKIQNIIKYALLYKNLKDQESYVQE